MRVIFLTTVLLTILILQLTIFESANASELTKIKVTLVGEPIINLDETNRFIRASVEVENYDAAGEGHFYMQLIQPGGKIISEEEILIIPLANQVWGTQIAGMLDDEKIMKGGKPVLGKYEIKIITELGSATGSAFFTIIKPSDPQLNPGIKNAIVELSSETNTKMKLELSSNTKVRNTDVSLTSNDTSQDELSSTKTKQISPRQQLSQGVSSRDVICNEGLKLIIKYDDSPACVTEKTVTKLIARGWTLN